MSKKSINVAKILAELKTRSETLLKDPAALGLFLNNVAEKLGHHQSFMSMVRQDVETLVRLIRLTISGHYQHFPWRTLILAVGALIYFVNPFDLIPDFIFGAGILDDIAVLTYVFNLIRQDLDIFRKWESGINALNGDKETIDVEIEEDDTERL